MHASRPGFFLIFLVSFLPLLATPLGLFASEDTSRDVRLDIVQGDVRLSRGNHNRPDLKQPWEEALSGESISQGFAISTGDGRASIDFEDGSTIYLAENSALLFNDLSVNDLGPASAVSLLAGSATFQLTPRVGNPFFISTPADRLFVNPPEDFFARVDAYVDATAINPQGIKGETLNRIDTAPVRFAKGETLFMQGGAVVEISAVLQQRRTVAPVSADWDPWVAERAEEKAAVMSAALKASGLSSPIPGLADLYRHGTFFQCAPYGTCWEPQESESARQSSTPQLPQNPYPGPGSNQTFQPVTVEIYEPQYGLCGLDDWLPVLHVAKTPQELEKLRRLQKESEGNRSRNSLFLYQGCYQHTYIFHKDRYARLVTLPSKPVCSLHRRCKGHPPFPHVTSVRVNGKLGFVPRHPDDKKGKPPVNLKNGVLFPPERPGQPIRRVTFDSSQKIKLETKLVADLQRELTPTTRAVVAPQIRAHVMREAFRDSHELSASAKPHFPQILLDYKSQRFMMSGGSSGDNRSKPVAVASVNGGRITSNYTPHSGSQHSGDSAGRAWPSAGNGGSHSGSASYSPHSGGSSGGGGSSHSYSGGSGGGNSGGSHYSGGSSNSSNSSSSGSSGSSASSSGGSSGGGAGARPH